LKESKGKIRNREEQSNGGSNKERRMERKREKISKRGEMYCFEPFTCALKLEVIFLPNISDHVQDNMASEPRRS
jgi:hypothetical protein